MNRAHAQFIILFLFLSLIAFFAFSFVIYSEPTHDYIHYMKQWKKILLGQNPWELRGNAYGAVHVYLAYLYKLDKNLPRILFCALYFITAAYISLRIYKNTFMDDATKTIIYTILFLNPLYWIFGLKFGINDFMMVFFIIFGLIFYKNKYDILAGLFFAIGIQVKFAPVVMIPFLILHRARAIHLRLVFALSFFITSLFIIGVNYLSWGDTILNPLLRAGTRYSKTISIFRFLRGDLSPLRVFTDNPNVDWLSVYLCFFSIVIYYFISLRYRFNNILSSIVAYLLLITLYKVGHIQFYITPVLLLLLWVCLDYCKITQARFLLSSVYLFIIWISFVSFLFLLTDSFRQTNWREILGLPNFLFSALLIILLIKYQYQNRFVTNRHSFSNQDSS